MRPLTPRLAIIGAGVAGLAAARALTGQPFAVTIYEKSAGVGGRAATRRVDGFVIDHGAQVFQAPNPALQRLVQTEPGGGLAPACTIDRPVWTFDATGTLRPGDPRQNAEPRWCWPDGITTLSKMLAAGLEVRYQVQVERIAAHSQGYTLHAASGAVLGQAEAVLLTAPGPQTAAIIAASTLAADLQTHLLQELARTSYRRCLSVALAYARRPVVPWYALVNSDRQHPIAWLACEDAKPGHAPSDRGLLIAQMAHGFSLAHWDEAARGTYATVHADHADHADDAAHPDGGQNPPLPSYLAQVEAAVQTLLAAAGADQTSPGGTGPLLWANLQRWRYALPECAADFAALNATGSGLFFAGDYVDSNGRIHQAIARGWQVADLIRQAGTP